jgi:hypothetical protein
MTKVQWDQVGQRVYETGVDRGVLYIPNNLGVYDDGFAWNGLTGITESPSGGEPTESYADNILYLVLRSAEKFGFTIEAYTYPDEFEQCDGTAQPQPGISVGQQARKAFGLSYRTLIGNDLEGTDFGYKIHLIYGATVSPSEKTRSTVNESPEAVTFSWEAVTLPTAVTGLRPAATMVIDSTKVDATALAALEDLLYGTVGTDPSLPTPDEVLALFEGTITEVTATAPSYNSSTDIVTIPSVTGVIYSVDGVVVPSGAFGPITESVMVTAVAAPGYSLSALSDDDWVITFV